MTTHSKANAYLRDKRTTGAIAPRTERAMRTVLHDFTSHCPQDPSKIRRQDVLRWLTTIRHLSPTTRHLYFAQVRGFATWLVRHGTLSRDPFVDIAVPKRPRTVHRALTPEQVQAILAACVTDRDRVLVVVGLHTGMRRAEMAALELGDLDLVNRTVFVRCGKFGHQRMVPLSTEAARFLAGYVARLGTSHGPLLRSEQDPQVGISAGTVGRLFSSLAYRAGVKVKAGDGVGTHSTRHSAASGWYEASGDVLAVRDLLGHVNLASTAVYVRGFNVERLRSTVEQTHYLPGAA